MDHTKLKKILKDEMERLAQKRTQAVQKNDSVEASHIDSRIGGIGWVYDRVDGFDLDE